MHVLSLFAVAAPLASAIQFTSPVDSSTQPKGVKVPLTWKSVNTDKPTFNIFLVNFSNYPPRWVKVANNVKTSSRSTTAVIPCDLPDSTGWQL